MTIEDSAIAVTMISEINAEETAVINAATSAAAIMITAAGYGC